MCNYYSRCCKWQAICSKNCGCYLNESMSISLGWAATKHQMNEQMTRWNPPDFCTNCRKIKFESVRTFPFIQFSFNTHIGARMYVYGCLQHRTGQIDLSDVVYECCCWASCSVMSNKTFAWVWLRNAFAKSILSISI